MLGAIDGRLFNIKGGNRQLAERLIKASDASLHLGTRVTGIYRGEHGTYELHTKCTSASLEVRLPSTASACWAISDRWFQSVLAILSKVSSTLCLLSGGIGQSIITEAFCD